MPVGSLIYNFFIIKFVIGAMKKHLTNFIMEILRMECWLDLFFIIYNLLITKFVIEIFLINL